MTIQECYDYINGDFKGACSRLLGAERVTKYAVRFLSDPDYNNLCKAIDNKDWKNAFLSVHTLKGLCLNLGFTQYGEVASLLTEELRGGLKSEENAIALFKQLSDEHNKVVKAFSQYSS